MIIDFSEPALDAFAKLCASHEMQNGFESATLDNLPTKLMLVVTELAEAVEAHRVIEVDIENLHEEIVDAIIRLFAIAGALGVSVTEVADKKLVKNKTRGVRHGKRY